MYFATKNSITDVKPNGYIFFKFFIAVRGIFPYFYIIGGGLVKYAVTVEGTFKTNVIIESENLKKAKIVAAEKFLTAFPAPTSYRIDMVSAFTDRQEPEDS